MFIQPKKFWLAGNASLYGVVGYQGPGDVVSGARAWGSPARAYNAAYAANVTKPAMDLLDQAGANPVTINILSTGFVDLAAISAWVTAHSVTTIKVTKLYDQTGNGFHWSNATLASMPALTLLALNGLPALTFTSAANAFLATTTGITQLQPFTFVAAAKRTTNFTTIQSMMGWTSSPNGQLEFTASANTVAITADGTSFVTQGSVTDNAFHAIQGISSGASSVIAVDGVENTGTNAATAPSANFMRLGRFAGGSSLDGMMLEAGFWGSAISNRTGLNSNIHGTNGYNF